MYIDSAYGSKLEIWNFAILRQLAVRVLAKC
jgi:hypothetical protein